MAQKTALCVLILVFMLRLAVANTYRLDPKRTAASFEVARFGVRWVRANFHDITGRFTIDPSGPVRRVDIDIGTASVEGPDANWNAKLRSAEWLDVERFPHITYHSSHIELAESRAVASGDLTLHGVTHAVVLDVSLSDCGRKAGPPADCRFSARGRIKRSDFGLPHGFWTGGDDVDIVLTGTAEAVTEAEAAQ